MKSPRDLAMNASPFLNFSQRKTEQTSASPHSRGGRLSSERTIPLKGKGSESQGPEQRQQS